MVTILGQLFAHKLNYALIMLLLTLLAYSAIGFSIDTTAAGDAALPPAIRQEPAAEEPSLALLSCSSAVCPTP